MSRGTPPCKNVYTQEILVAGQPFCRHRWGDSVKRRNEHIRNRTKYNIKIRIDRNPTKQKKVNFGSAQRFFKCCGLTDKNSRASWRDFEILRGISNIYLFASRFHALLLKMFCENVAGKHWFMLWPNCRTCRIVWSWRTLR